MRWCITARLCHVGHVQLKTYFCCMKVDNVLVAKLAKLARLSFDEEGKEAIRQDLERMLAFAEQLNELDTEGVEPLIHINPEKNVLRADEVTESLTQAQALKNAPQHDTYYFKVPKVVENKEN